MTYLALLLVALLYMIQPEDDKTIEIDCTVELEQGETHDSNDHDTGE